MALKVQLTLPVEGATHGVPVTVKDALRGPTVPHAPGVRAIDSVRVAVAAWPLAGVTVSETFVLKVVALLEKEHPRAGLVVWPVVCTVWPPDENVHA
jgi:hypothetical protein